jgi:ParB-like chromosome segregation protein Spo0J
MAKPEPKAKWRNRIVGHGEVDPNDLVANPRNWRIHPQAQQEALEGVLEDVGWVDTVLVNQRTGFVVDGHLRVQLALRREEHEVPVTYLDLSEDEELEVLASYDPLSAMAV